MVKKIIKSLVIGLGIFLLNPSAVSGQTGLLKKLKPSISYVAIDSWKSYAGNLQFRDDDGSAVGFGLKYPLKDSTLYVRFTYQRARISSVDLRDDFGVSNYILDFGKSFQLGQKSTINPNVGLAVIRYPAYFSLGFDRTMVRHTHSGFRGFESVKLGVDYLYDLGTGIKVGGGISAFRSFDYKIFERGSTTFALMVELGL